MPQEMQKHRIKEMLTRIFKPGEEAESDSVHSAESSLEDYSMKEVGPSPHEVPSEEERSPTVQTIADKVAILKKAFEFEPGLKSRLAEIVSVRDLLLFLHDAVLFRFGKLREIGLINPESFEVLGALNEKLGSVLTQDLSILAGEVGPPDTEELRRENLELKERMEALHARYVKTGIITEKELEQEKEIRFLQSKVREQHSQLDIARKRLKILASYQDMVQSLRAKNSLLNSRLENQTRLLKTLTANNPGQQELVSSVEKLEDENSRLRKDLDRQTELLDQLKIHLPDSLKQTAGELITRNAGLYADLEHREAQLKSVDSSEHSKEGLLDNIERLSQANIQLKNSIGAAQIIESYIKDQKKGTGDPDKVIAALQTENKRLELALDAKEEQIQVLSADPASRKLIRAYSNLQNEYRELYMENKVQGQLYQQEIEAKKALMAQVREQAALIKENQRLQTELESGKRLADLFRKLELQYKLLKKDHSEIKLKYERALVDLEVLNKKLAKVSTEYEQLIKEYENIFSIK